MTTLSEAVGTANENGYATDTGARVTAACSRWLADFVEGRLHKAAREVLPYLEDRIAHTVDAERASLVARADELRRSLR